jgi:hypothetical protein
MATGDEIWHGSGICKPGLQHSSSRSWLADHVTVSREEISQATESFKKNLAVRDFSGDQLNSSPVLVNMFNDSSTKYRLLGLTTFKKYSHMSLIFLVVQLFTFPSCLFFRAQNYLFPAKHFFKAVFRRPDIALEIIKYQVINTTNYFFFFCAVES